MSANVKSFALIGLARRRHHFIVWSELGLWRPVRNTRRAISEGSEDRACAHIQTQILCPERPESPPRGVETVTSGARKRGRGGEKEDEILFEQSDTCYVMTCATETRWERKWKGVRLSLESERSY